MILLGIDPSMRGCGYVIQKDGKDILDVGEFKTEKLTGEPIFRYLAIQDGIRRLVDNFGVTHVSSEAVVFATGAKGTQVPALFSLYIMLQVIFMQAKLPVVYILPKQWIHMVYRPNEFLWAKNGGKTKKDKRRYKELTEDEQIHLDGLNLDWQLRGKQQTIDRVKEETGFRLTHNEADAYCLTKFGRIFWLLKEGKLKKEDLSKEEDSIFLGIKTVKKLHGLPVPEPIEVKEGILYKQNKSPGWFDFNTVEIPVGIHKRNKNFV